MLMTGTALQSEKEENGTSSNADASNVVQTGKSLFGRSSLDIELQTDGCQSKRDPVEW
jgi:hypothetical protein